MRTFFELLDWILLVAMLFIEKQDFGKDISSEKRCFSINLVHLKPKILAVHFWGSLVPSFPVYGFTFGLLE